MKFESGPSSTCESDTLLRNYGLCGLIDTVNLTGPCRPACNSGPIDAWRRWVQLGHRPRVSTIYLQSAELPQWVESPIPIQRCGQQLAISTVSSGSRSGTGGQEVKSDIMGQEISRACPHPATVHESRAFPCAAYQGSAVSCMGVLAHFFLLFPSRRLCSCPPSTGFLSMNCESRQR